MKDIFHIASAWPELRGYGIFKRQGQAQGHRNERSSVNSRLIPSNTLLDAGDRRNAAQNLNESRQPIAAASVATASATSSTGSTRNLNTAKTLVNR